MWIPLLLVAATAAVYQDVRRHDFVDLDDLPYVLENRDLRVSSPVEALRVAFTSTSQVNWTPLTVLSLQVDRALYGDRAPGYLLGNVALHAASAVLLFFALRRLSGDTGPSAFAAGVFALHPLHVESVAWVAQRKDTLSGLFWMLGLLAHARQAEQPTRARQALVALAFCGGLLAKPVVVTLPFVLLLLDYWPLGRLGTAAGRRRAVLEKLPLLAPLVAVAVLTWLLQAQVDAMPDARLGLAARVANAVDAYAVYLRQTFWPSGLAVFYPHPGVGIAAARVAAAAALLAAITAASLLLARTRPYLLVGWLWYLGVLVPTIGLVQVGSQAHADRYTYLPMIGLAIAVGWGARDLVGGSRAGRAWATAAGAVSLLALGATAALQVTHWRNAVTLHEHAVAVTRDNPAERLRLARALRLAGRPEQALLHLERAVALAPSLVASCVDLADLQAQLGRVESAVDTYRSCLRRAPDRPLIHANLGLALLRLEQYRLAKRHLKQALLLQAERAQAGARGPELTRPHLALVEAHVSLGELDRALAHHRIASELDSEGAALSAERLALALAEAGRLQEARELLVRARAAQPGSARLRAALRNVDASLAEAGAATPHSPRPSGNSSLPPRSEPQASEVR